MAKIPQAIGLVFLIKYSWIILMVPYFVYLYFSGSIDNERGKLIAALMETDRALWVLILFAPFTEELLFRMPLAILAWLRLPIELIIVCMVMLSAWFGMAHGNAYNILAQGVAGLLYSIMFLKCGGLQGKPFRAFLVTFTMHAINNALFYLSFRLF